DAVAADQPALLLELPVGLGLAQLLGRPDRAGLLGREEAGEVPADDLLRRVAEDLLRPVVPAHHPAAGVEHEDGIGLDPFEKEVHPLPARGQGLCTIYRLGHVTHPLFGRRNGPRRRIRPLSVTAPRLAACAAARAVTPP